MSREGTEIRRRARPALAPPLLALALGMLVSAGVTAAAGHDPLRAFAALAQGAFGSIDGWSEVGVKSCPLMLTGIAVALAFRAGIWNIGAEGQLIMGAVVVVWLGGHAGGLPPLAAAALALSGAAVAGAAWATVPTLLRLHRGVSEVISTIMLNFVALYLLSYLVHGPLMESGGAYPQTEPLPDSMQLGRPFAGLRLHAGLLVALGTGALVHLLLFRTVPGYALRVAGENPEAGRLAGLGITRSLWIAFLSSGAVAGLAGGIEVMGVTFRLYERFSPGYGYTAIAVALLGRLHPLGVLLAALFFGALEAGSGTMQRAAGVSAVLVSVIQATVVFSLLAVDPGPLKR